MLPPTTHLCLQNGELSSLEEYYNEEDPLDYTEKYNDVVLPRDLYTGDQPGMAFRAREPAA